MGSLTSVQLTQMVNITSGSKKQQQLYRLQMFAKFTHIDILME